MEDDSEYIVRRDRWLVAVLALNTFLLGIGLALSTFAGWVFITEVVEDGTRVLIGGGYLVCYLLLAVFTVVAGRRQRIARAEIVEWVMFDFILMILPLEYATFLCPQPLLSLCDFVLIAATAPSLWRRLRASLRHHEPQPHFAAP